MDVREKLVEIFCSVLGVEPNFSDAEAMEFVEGLIANGVTVQEWISVKDRLPEQYHSVIVWTSDKELGEAAYDGERFCWTADDEFAKVTYWMPLPEPPKGE